MLFPPEIINDTTESLFVKRTVHSKAIYLVVVLAVAAAIAALPFIYVQISTQARGIIRTPNENNMTENSYFRSAIYEQQTSINYLQKEYQTSKSLYELNVTQTEYLQRKNAYDAAVSQMANPVDNSNTRQ